MSRTHTFKSAKECLESLTDNIQLVEYSPGMNSKSLFKLADGSLVEYQFGSLIHKLRQNRSFVPRSSRLSFEKAQAKLASVTDDYELVKFRPGKKSLCVFFDKKRRRSSSGRFNDLIQNLKRNKDYILNATPEEISEVRRQAALASPKSPEVKARSVERAQATRIERGLTQTIAGETLPEIASRLGLSYSTVQQAVKDASDKEAVIETLESLDGFTSIEKPIQELLDFHNVSFITNKKLEDSSFRPDFLCEEEKVIVECDGLYWHSDAVLSDKKYHIKKLAKYEDLGYRALFFRGDEIRTKQPIVESIILNALGRTPRRVFARKCTIQEIRPCFLEKNHLMGKGAGRVWALHYKEEVVAAIQLKWKNKKDKVLEVSRFCTALHTSVVGGFSKLLAHAEKEYKPSEIVTFIDRRYGQGSYLSELGFVSSKTHPSFCWVRERETFHRMKFRGNSGYDFGCYKLWDCGQTKWTKLITSATI